MRDFTRMISVLFVVCGVAAGSLAVMNAVTKEPIASYEKRAREAALREVFADADEFVDIQPDRAWEALREDLKKGGVFLIQDWEALRKGQKPGHVFLIRVQGYSGPVTLMFGTDSSGAVTGLVILSHTETPGLGAKIITAKFRDQFRNKRPEQLILRKHDPARGQIDAVTGATISSRAVTRALSTTIESFNSEKAGGDK